MSVKDSIASQYHASLDMLRQAVIKCPDSLWDDREYRNVFWHVAYHALHYTHLYLQHSGKHFAPWAKHRKGSRNLSQRPVGEPPGKEEILEYLELCREQVEEQVAAMERDAPSGYAWLPSSTLELQFYNIRHLQQHIGELCKRLGVTGDIDVNWVVRKSRP